MHPASCSFSLVVKRIWAALLGIVEAFSPLRVVKGGEGAVLRVLLDGRDVDECVKIGRVGAASSTWYRRPKA